MKTTMQTFFIFFKSPRMDTNKSLRNIEYYTDNDNGGAGSRGGSSDDNDTYTYFEIMSHKSHLQVFFIVLPNDLFSLSIDY